MRREIEVVASQNNRLHRLIKNYETAYSLLYELLLLSWYSQYFLFFTSQLKGYGTIIRQHKR